MYNMGMADYHCMEWYIKRTKEEFSDAKKYAELAVKHKEQGDTKNGKMFYDMANQELTHAMTIHEMGVEFMNKWREKESLAEWITDKWDKADESYTRHVGKIKYMLSEFAK